MVKAGTGMLIGQVQELTGASGKAIRLYEELGLLGNVGRRGKYRTYTEEHVQLIRLIRHAQKTGLKLKEMLTVLQASAEKASPWNTVLDLIEQRQQQVAEELERLHRQQALLRAYRVKIEECLSISPGCQLTDEKLDSAP
jgi:MerR family copper efflux transcriptional regulator